MKWERLKVLLTHKPDGYRHYYSYFFIPIYDNTSATGSQRSCSTLSSVAVFQNFRDNGASLPSVMGASMNRGGDLLT